jgi:hypothetical protein
MRMSHVGEAWVVCSPALVITERFADNTTWLHAMMQIPGHNPEPP